MTSLITPKGPVIVPIQVDSQTVGGAKSSSVKSIYGKKVSLGGDSILQRLKDGALVYADPEQAQVAVTGRGSVTPIGVNAREAQFSDARPIEVQDVSVAGVPLLDENRGFFNRYPSRFDQSRRLGRRSHFVSVRRQIPHVEP